MGIEINEDNLNEFFQTMFERQEIWYRRFIKKEKKPWTTDQIFRDYKFTNVYRELDRATQFLIKNILTNHSLTREDLLFQILVYRTFNLPDPFESKVYPVTLPLFEDYDPDKLLKQVTDYRNKVGLPFHNAYYVNVTWFNKFKKYHPNIIGELKDYAFCKVAFVKMHEIVSDLIKLINVGVTNDPKFIIKVLNTLPGTSYFQSYEFYLDFCLIAKYWKEPLFDFNENDYVNVGPGATAGLKFIFLDVKAKDYMNCLRVLLEIAHNYLMEYGNFKYLHWNGKEYVLSDKFNFNLHQIEFWLCEYSKYNKIKANAGRRRIFVSATNTPVIK